MKRRSRLLLGLTIAILFAILLLLKFANHAYETERIKKIGGPALSQLSPPPSSAPMVYTDTVALLDKKLVHRHHNLLGTPAYINEIQSFVTQLGPRKAFSVVMSDVALYEKDLDQNTPDNLQSFHRLVSTLVYKVGYVDPEMHYFRNKLNRTPKSLNDLIHYNATAPVNMRWKLLTVLNSVYHIQGRDGEYHLKFVSYDGYCEAVFDRKGRLLDQNTDPINMGTYNYSAGLPFANAHLIFDMDPFLLYGNTPNCSERGKAAINYGVHLALVQYQAHAMDVFQYRKSLFGVQSGRVQ